MTAGQNNVRVGIAVFVFKDGKFLMAQRHGAHGPGTWSVPGGHLEFGESFEETARREVKEETALEITNIRFGAVTNELWAVDANGSTELQYAMALGYAPTVSEALQLVTSPAYEGAGVLAVAESVEASEVFAGNAVPHIGRYEDDVAIETVEVSHPSLTDVESA